MQLGIPYSKELRRLTFSNDDFWDFILLKIFYFIKEHTKTTDTFLHSQRHFSIRRECRLCEHTIKMAPCDTFDSKLSCDSIFSGCSRTVSLLIEKSLRECWNVSRNCYMTPYLLCSHVFSLLIKEDLRESRNLSVKFRRTLFCAFRLETTSFSCKIFPFLFLFLCYPYFHTPASTWTLHFMFVLVLELSILSCNNYF